MKEVAVSSVRKGSRPAPKKSSPKPKRIEPAQEDEDDGDDEGSGEEFDGETIELAGGKSIRVKVTEFIGREYLDIRNYFTSQDGDVLPTKKGIMIPRDKASAVYAAIKKVCTR